MWRAAAFLLAMTGAAEAAIDPAGIEMFRRAAPACALPLAAPEHQLVALGLATPVMLSDLAFADRQDEAAVVVIRVEPGAQKLAVAIFADGDTIYSFDDPDHRVASVQVIYSGTTAAGIAGVPREKVALIEFSRCAGWRDGLSGERGRRGLPIMLGREPLVIWLSDAVRLSIPSGQAERVEGQPGLMIYEDGRSATRRTPVVVGPDGRARRDPTEVFSASEIDPELLLQLDAYPGGLMRLDPGQVIATVPVGRSARIPPPKP